MSTEKAARLPEFLFLEARSDGKRESERHFHYLPRLMYLQLLRFKQEPLRQEEWIQQLYLGL